MPRHLFVLVVFCIHCAKWILPASLDHLTFLLARFLLRLRLLERIINGGRDLWVDLVLAAITNCGVQSLFSLHTGDGRLPTLLLRLGLLKRIIDSSSGLGIYVELTISLIDTRTAKGRVTSEAVENTILWSHCLG